MKTKLKNINLPSSYTHDFGVVLYEQVLKHQPEVVYDIGVLHGFSTAYLSFKAFKNPIELSKATFALL